MDGAAELAQQIYQHKNQTVGQVDQDQVKECQRQPVEVHHGALGLLLVGQVLPDEDKEVLLHDQKRQYGQIGDFRKNSREIFQRLAVGPEVDHQEGEEAVGGDLAGYLQVGLFLEHEHHCHDQVFLYQRDQVVVLYEERAPLLQAGQQALDLVLEAAIQGAGFLWLVLDKLLFA